MEELLGRFFIFEKDIDGYRHTSEISEEYYNILKLETSKINEFKYLLRKTMEIVLNYDEYFNTFNHYEAKLKQFESDIKKENDLLESAFVDLNRTFINYITSIRYSIEHLEIRLTKRYGKDSLEFKSFKHFLSSKYDTFFAYKFMYHLRNYIVHKAEFPIYIVDFDKDYLKNEKKLNAYFSKDKLLENDEFKGKMQNELKRFNSEFPVEPQILALLPIYKELLHKVTEIDSLYLKNAVNTFSEIIAKFPQGTTVSFGFIEKTRDGFVHNLTIIEALTIKFLIDTGYFTPSV